MLHPDKARPCTGAPVRALVERDGRDRIKEEDTYMIRQRNWVGATTTNKYFTYECNKSRKVTVKKAQINR